jgi:tetratricopeptide (TPR) repeat protein
MESLETQLAQLESAQLVRRLAEEDPSTVLRRAQDDSSGQGLVYLFKHALTQEAAYQSLLLKTRREMHRRIAEVIERLYAGDLDENAALLVRHYAEAGDYAKVVEYAARAGAAAAKVYAHAEARAYFLQVLDALTHLPASDDNRRRHVDTCIEYLKLAWTIEPIPHLLALCAEAEQLVQKLVASAGLSPDNLSRLALVHYAISSMHMLRNELPLALDYYHRALEEAQAINAVELIAFIRAFVGLIRTDQGYLMEGEKHLAEAWAVLSHAPDRWESNVCLGSYGLCLALRGKAATILPRLEEARDRLEAANNEFSLLPIWNYLCQAQLWAGDVQHAAAGYANLVARAGKAGEFFHFFFALGFHGLILSRLGNHEAAAAEMAQSKAIREKMGGRTLWDNWFAAAEAEIARNAGRPGEAQALAEQAVLAARAVDSIFAEGWAQRVWGEALAKDEAEPHFAESLSLFELGDARLEAARTHVAWGKLLQARGNADQAREHFQKAAVQFEASSLTHELDQVHTLLAA